jgi:shikimate kinase
LSGGMVTDISRGCGSTNRLSQKAPAYNTPPMTPITSRNLNKVGIFALGGGRIDGVLPVRGTVYAIAGFGYKYTMSDVVEHNGASKDAASQPNASLPVALGRRSIVLVGMMGAGKSSVGRRLATRLAVPFVDADAEIEKAHAGMTISEIFATHGEPYFRAGETRVIARLLDGGPQVLATGGGAFMSADTRNAIRLKGVSVWLRATIDVLNRRIKRRGDRPLLKGTDPAETLRRLLDEREPVYAMADFTVESRDVPHETIVDEILAGLRGWIAPGGAAGGRNAPDGTPIGGAP